MHDHGEESLPIIAVSEPWQGLVIHSLDLTTLKQQLLGRTERTYHQKANMTSTSTFVARYMSIGMLLASVAEAQTVTLNLLPTTSGGSGTEPLTYNDFSDFCDANGMRMCTYNELCPDGDETAMSGTAVASAPALSGVLAPIVNQDLWVPYANAQSFVSNDNVWVQLGNREDVSTGDLQTCLTHVAVAGSAPSWGLDTTFEPFLHYTLCCDDCKPPPMCPNVFEYWNGNKCRICPRGYVQSPTDVEVCEVCEDGDVRGSAPYEANGSGRTGCQSVVDTLICEMTEYANGGKCKNCPPGYVGYPDFLACTPCGNGELADPSLGCIDAYSTPSPAPTTKQCGPHEVASLGKCRICPAGYERDPVTLTCAQCPDGKIRPRFYAGSCYDAGTEQIDDQGVVIGEACEAGSYAAGGGRCVGCPNMYEPNQDLTGCVKTAA